MQNIHQVRYSYSEYIRNSNNSVAKKHIIQLNKWAKALIGISQEKTCKTRTHKKNAQYHKYQGIANKKTTICRPLTPVTMDIIFKIVYAIKGVEKRKHTVISSWTCSKKSKIKLYDTTIPLLGT